MSSSKTPRSGHPNPMIDPMIDSMIDSVIEEVTV